MDVEDLNNFPIEIINSNIDSGDYIESNTGISRFYIFNEYK